MAALHGTKTLFNTVFVHMSTNLDNDWPHKKRHKSHAKSKFSGLAERDDTTHCSQPELIWKLWFACLKSFSGFLLNGNDQKGFSTVECMSLGFDPASNHDSEEWAWCNAMRVCANMAQKDVEEINQARLHRTAVFSNKKNTQGGICQVAACHENFESCFSSTTVFRDRPHFGMLKQQSDWVFWH